MGKSADGANDGALVCQLQCASPRCLQAVWDWLLRAEHVRSGSTPAKPPGLQREAALCPQGTELRCPAPALTMDKSKRTRLPSRPVCWMNAT